MRVVTVGDLLLDVVVRLEQPLAASADATSSTTLSTGGQAANVAAWIAALGGSAGIVTRIATDPAGSLARETLDRLGVDVLGPVVLSGTGVIVSLVGPDGDRTMCSDRGVTPGLAPDEIDAGWFEGCDVLHVSGYALAREPIRLAVDRSVALARAAGARISVDLSSWSVIRDVGPEVFRERVATLRPDVVFANEDEERVVGGRIEGATWIVKRGARGCVFDGVERDALPVDVVDATGAGDALAAGWLLGGADLALEAASRCVAAAGSTPR